ncbi:helix-turn-helix transcriptional regulator [Paraburkholderia acidisoli]|uniref:AlpA family phage regulatory protein n=1 Tax=Paraburkholderia acidisoli TaxID=2571748 RepID=A0A7Z2GJ86_9BURK|nr:AlpA family transcriptional regulator [Paraburkholderia acidisoli]QGZ62474.1 AlpA family phage regulatory protein [Paraburkholderia acidisoli]
MTQPSAERLLRLPIVMARVGLSRATVYRLVKDGCFPGPVRIGVRAVAWRASEIDAWMESRPPYAGE